jgi:hypothetical protein
VVTREEPLADRREVLALSQGVDRWPVVMSDAAWSDFDVYGYPFFVLLDGTSRSVVGETIGFDWTDVERLLESGRAGEGGRSSGAS